VAEVSYRSLGFVVDVVQRRGIDPAPLLEGLAISPEDASRLRGGFAWSTFAELLRRASRALEPCGGIEQAVYEHADAPLPAWLAPVARALVRPRDVLWMGARWMGRTMWPITTATFEDISRTRVRETIAIPDECEDAPEFFIAIRGAIRSAPRLLGYGDAVVDMQLAPRFAIYTIELPTRIVAARHPSSSHDEILKAIEEMGAQLDELQATQEALRAMNRELEQRVGERTRELTASRMALEQSHRLASLGTLAAGVAHELNNPLAAIRATAQLAEAVQRRDPAKPLDASVLGQIQSEAQRASRIVRGLLQFSRGERAETWETTVASLVERAVAIARPLAERAGVRIELAGGDVELRVLANPVQLEQALVCIAQNALDASPAASAITIRWTSGGGRVRIRIADSGSGIAAAAFPHLFEPFFTTRQAEGAVGLGLSIAHGIVEQHGGQIEIETSRGAGTTVTIELPEHTAND